MQSCFSLMCGFRASLGINRYFKGLYQVSCFLSSLLRFVCGRAGKAEFIPQAWSSSFPWWWHIASRSRQFILISPSACCRVSTASISVHSTEYLLPSSPRTQMTWSQVLPPFLLSSFHYPQLQPLGLPRVAGHGHACLMTVEEGLHH